MKMMDKVSTDTLGEGKWVSLKVMRDPGKPWDGVEFASEKASNGIKVAVMPFDQLGYRVLLRQEVTPSWSLEPSLSSVTGGVEPEGPDYTAVKELLEETGYRAEEPELIKLGICYGSKSMDTVYHRYAVDVTGKSPELALGDGTPLEKSATTIWLSGGEWEKSNDPLVYVLRKRLQNHLLDSINKA